MFISLQTVPVKKKPTHRGEILARVAAQSDLSVMQIVRRAGYKTRGSFYAHIKDPNLSYEKLEKYGKALNHNFKEDFSGMPDSVTEESLPPPYKVKTLEEAIEVIEYWRNRFYKELEKNNKLLEKLNLPEDKSD